MKKLLTALFLSIMCISVLFAVGCSKKYTVTFDAAGGSFAGGGTTVEVKVQKGDTVDIDVQPTKQSANFLYWAVNGSEYIFSTPVNGNMTISAVWQEIYTVTFSAGDGAFEDGTKQKTVSVTEGESVAVPEDVPTVANGKFLTWQLGGEDYEFSNAVNSSITLVACYKPLGSFAVTFTDGEGYSVEGLKNGEIVEEDEKVSFTLDIGAFYTNPALVKVNETVLEADVNGVYSFVVKGESEITVVGVKEDVSNMVGAGTEDNPYFVSRPIDLIYIAEMVNAGFVSYVNAYYQFENDIDLKGEELKVIGDGTPVDVGGGQIVNAYFSGYVNGMGHTISNYTINTTNGYAGLFGQVVCDPTNGHFGTIYDLHLKDFEINASFPGAEEPSLTVGSLVAYGVGVNVYLCTATGGAITVRASDEYYSTIVGGLIGVQEAMIYESTVFFSSVVYCNTEVDIYIDEGKALFAGGITGYLYSGYEYAVSYVANCYSSGYVSGAVSVGGIVGCLGQNNSVTNSYSTSNLAAKSTITNLNDLYIYCAAYAGGVVGMAENDTIINACFATGNLSAVSNVSMDGFELTDGICAGKINDYSLKIDAQPGVVRNSYYAKGGKDKANGVDLTSAEFIKANLGWKEYDWVLEDGKYPVFNFESSSITFNFTINFSGRTVANAPEYVVSIEDTYIPISFLYVNAYAYEYVVAESEEISYGLFFDEQLTQRVPLCFVVTDTLTVYAGFADYTEVAGTYLVEGEDSSYPAYITLGKDGVITYTDGSAISTSFYVYDGESIIIEDARLARYISDLPYGDHLGLYDFKAVIVKDEGGVAQLRIFDGSIYTEQAPLYATASVGADASYYTATESLTFNPDFTGVYVNADGSYSFEYTVAADGSLQFTVGQESYTAVLGEQGCTVNGVSFGKTDDFAGSWQQTAAVNKVYTFDGKGGWSYEYYGYTRQSGVAVKQVISTYSGSYTYNEDGSITLSGSSSIAYFNEDGALVIETEIGGQTYVNDYYKSDSFVGEWRDSRMGATLYLMGITLGGVGYGLVEYDSGYYYELTYGTENGNTVIYSGVDYFGYLNYSADTDMITANLYYEGTGTVISGFTFKRTDDIAGEWISENELFELISFGGMGAYSGDTLTIGVEDVEKVVYFIENSTQNGSFTYGGSTYTFTYDEVTERLTVTCGDLTVELERKDDFADIVYIDGNGVEYSFDGRGNLASGGALTVVSDTTEVFGYKINGSKIEVYENGASIGSIERHENVYRYTVGSETTDLYIKTPYTGVWAVSGSYGLLEIGGVSLNGIIKGKYLGREVEIHYLDEYLKFFYLTYDRYLFIFEDDIVGTEEVEYCVVVSDLPTLVSGAYKICSRADDMFGEWKQNGSSKVFRFDGITNSKYVNGQAEISMGAASTGYYYRDDGKGGLVIWSRELASTLIYKTVWCDVSESGAYVNAQQNRAFKLVEVDALYTISATDKSTGKVYTFDGEGTVECEGNEYAYEIVKYDNGDVIITVTIDGVKYDALVLTYADIIIEFLGESENE